MKTRKTRFCIWPAKLEIALAVALISTLSACQSPPPQSPHPANQPLDAAYGNGTINEVALQGAAAGRSVFLYRPPQVEAGRPKAVIVLHGFKGDAQISRYYGLEREADKYGFYVVYPFAPGKEWSIGKNFPSTDAAIAARDDATYLLAAIDMIVRDYAVNPAGVFMAGQSMGGIMAVSFACDHADKVKGVAMVASGMTSGQLADCRPNSKLDILLLLGGEDPILPPIGGRSKAITGVNGDPIWLLDYPETLAFWAKANGCDGVASKRTQGTGAASLLLTSYAGCKGPKVAAKVIAHMGHRWPGTNFQERLAETRIKATEEGSLDAFLGPASFAVDGAQEVWRFFSDP